MKMLSPHCDTAKAFVYLLKQWDALNLYCKIDNNIAENALRGVALGRKNWLFAGSDTGGERVAIPHSLVAQRRESKGVAARCVEHIQDLTMNQLRNLLPWETNLTPAVSAQI